MEKTAANPDLRAQVIAILGSIAPEIEAAELRDDRPLRQQVDLDSADWLNFLVAVHQRLGVDIPDADVAKLSTLDKLADHIRKLPKRLQPQQITDIRQRLRALDALRPPVPVPKGPMPTSSRQVKGVRQAMRGR